MSLLHPEFLLALAALAIPIIIHLFNFRRFRKVVFPNVRFLKEVDLKTRSKNKLKHILILLSRMLALAALVIAFARPFLPVDNQAEVVDKRHIAVYVDNSFSMDLEGTQGNLLARSIETAEKISESFGSNDRFLLITNDLKAEHNRSVSAEEFREFLGGIRQSPNSRSFAEVYERAADALSREGGNGKKLFYLSDLQSKSFDPINARLDSTMTTRIIQMEHEGQGNVYIDSVWFESPVRSTHSPERLAVRIVNASGKDVYDLPVKLSVAGKQKAIGNVTLKPFSSVDSILTFSNETSGWQSAEVSLKDHPITFDDRLYISYDVREQCNVSIIGPGATRYALERIYANDPFYAVSSSDDRQVDMAALREQDLVIVAGLTKVSSGMTRELAKFAAQGGSVCLIPSLGGDVNSYNELLLALGANTYGAARAQSVKTSKLDTDHPLFEDVFDQVPRNMDLPVVQRSFEINERVRSRAEKVMTLQNGTPLLSSYPSEKGISYVFSSGVDKSESNLGSHSLFVTSLLRMAELSAGYPSIYQEIGADRAIEMRLGARPSDAVYQFKAQGADYSFIPEQRSSGSTTLFHERGQVSEAGVYEVTADDTRVAQVAFNYGREESEMIFMDQEGAMADLQRNGALDISFIASDDISDAQSFGAALAGTPLWRYFILLALLFLAAEILLIKLWK